MTKLQSECYSSLVSCTLIKHSMAFVISSFHVQIDFFFSLCENIVNMHLDHKKFEFMKKKKKKDFFFGSILKN
jgi:hypothetical protein